MNRFNVLFQIIFQRVGINIQKTLVKRNQKEYNGYI